MKYAIGCSYGRNNNALDFILYKGNERLYLFSQRFSTAVYRHFAVPLPATKAFSFDNTHSKSVQNAIERLRTYRRYIKCEYGIEILPQKICRPYVREHYNKYADIA